MFHGETQHQRNVIDVREISVKVGLQDMCAGEEICLLNLLVDTHRLPDRESNQITTSLFQYYTLVCGHHIIIIIIYNTFHTHESIIILQY